MYLLFPQLSPSYCCNTCKCPRIARALTNRLAILFPGGLKCDCPQLFALFLREEISSPQQSLKRGPCISASALWVHGPVCVSHRGFISWAGVTVPPSLLFGQGRADRAMSCRKHLKPRSQTNKEGNGAGGDNTNLASSII